MTIIESDVTTYMYCSYMYLTMTLKKEKRYSLKILHWCNMGRVGHVRQLWMTKEKGNVVIKPHDLKSSITFSALFVPQPEENHTSNLTLF